ncbi:MAG: hypothetical protein IKQ07_04650 [Bacteroidaceae bacterium]|nr:hypothetical protein [Bacteroidaceae bacterium]
MKSARIKRRNKQGFKGIGNHNPMPEGHKFGDYRDRRTNHKRTKAADALHAMIKFAGKWGCKHPGSKHPGQLMMYQKPASGPAASALSV